MLEGKRLTSTCVLSALINGCTSPPARCPEPHGKDLQGSSKDKQPTTMSPSTFSSSCIIQPKPSCLDWCQLQRQYIGAWGPDHTQCLHHLVLRPESHETVRFPAEFPADPVRRDTVWSAAWVITYSPAKADTNRERQDDPAGLSFGGSGRLVEPRYNLD